MAKKRKGSKGQRRRKAVGAAPVWLKTVLISVPQRPKPIRGTFGAASEVVRIDPETGRPIEAA